MLSQKEYDKISHITEQDFITILTAVEGGVDWEYLILLYAMSEYDDAIRLMNAGWDDAVKIHQNKANKAMNYLNTFRKLNS